VFEIVIASRNKEKKKELKALLRGLKIKVLDLSNFSAAPKVEEKGKSFQANAKTKAVTIARFTRRLTLADDSGLEVKALGGKPGVRSARFAGKGTAYAANNRKLLKLLSGVPKSKRKAKFVCVIAIADKNGAVKTVRDECHGWISFFPKGRSGFGYDPVFVYPKYNKTFAELGPKIKNKVSHRARALKKAKAIIQKYLRRYL